MLTRRPYQQIRMLALFLLLGSGFLLQSAQAQFANVTVTGQVLRFANDSVGGGQPESGVTIQLFTSFGTSPIDTATTGADGRYQLSAPAGLIYRLTASKGVRLGAFEFTGTGSFASRLGGTVTRNLVAHRPAIVMVAGFTGLNLPQDSCPQNIPGRTYSPGVCPVNAFDSEEGSATAQNVPRELSDNGYHVQIAVLDSNVFGTPSIANLVPIVTDAIDKARAVTGISKVIVVSHSTGGIVSRRYIESSGYRDDVSHFFTFGTPHQGAPIERIAGVLIPLMEVVAGPGLGIGSFGAFCLVQRAACDMSEAGMASFNLSFRPRASVSYHVIQGDAVRYRTCTTFGIPYPCANPNNASLNLKGSLIDAINNGDGLINRNSLNLAGTHDRLLTFDAHGWDFGNPWYLQRTGARQGEGYTDCIRPVLVLRQRFNCGTISTAAATSVQEADLDTPTQYVPVQRGSLSTSEVVTRTVSIIESDRPAAFSASWASGDAAFTLVMPGGQRVDPAFAIANSSVVSFTNEPGQISYSFTQAPTGTYTLELTATSTLSGSLSYRTSAGFESDYTFSAGRDRNWYAPGAVATISATLAIPSGSPPLSGVTVSARITRADGTIDNLALAPNGSGGYQATYNVPDDGGYANVDLVATGDISGTTIERAQNLHFQIYPPSFKLTGVYSESASFDGLQIGAGIEATDLGGALRVTGILRDGNGREIAVATTLADISAGSETVVLLDFAAADLLAAAVNGPYTLGRVLLIDERGPALVSDDLSNVYTTSAYNVEEFRRPTIYLPLVIRPE